MTEYYRAKNMFENNTTYDPISDFCNLNEGNDVVYMGNVLGGPSIGAAGKIKKIYARKALVDMGSVGTWNIPYCFLAAA
tara:strand:+ start:66 stop:302 length:237 start_codon:yes stop_codon:yes gene_type:complete